MGHFVEKNKTQNEQERESTTEMKHVWIQRMLYNVKLEEEMVSMNETSGKKSMTSIKKVRCVRFGQNFNLKQYVFDILTSQPRPVLSRNTTLYLKLR